jgi:hypothetical protein
MDEISMYPNQLTNIGDLIYAHIADDGSLIFSASHASRAHATISFKQLFVIKPEGVKVLRALLECDTHGKLSE